MCARVGSAHVACAENRTNSPSSSWLVVGPKGCGKSQRLRRLVTARAVAFPASFNVFVDIRHTAVPNLRTLLWREFVAWQYNGADAGPLPDRTMAGIVQWIRTASGLPVLLAVDELHTLFTRSAPESAADFIKDLLELAESEVNHCVTFLCGSAAATAPLCFGDYDGKPSDFTAYKPGKSLNGTKFKKLRVPPPDIVVTRFIVEQHVPATEAADADARAVDVDAAVEEAMMTAIDCRSIACIARDGSSAAVTEQAESVVDHALHTAMMNAMFAEHEGDKRTQAVKAYVVHLIDGGLRGWFPRQRLLDADFQPSQLFAAADKGLLRLEEGKVAFAAPFQLARVCPRAVAGDVGLSWYEHLCLAYPYGQLGIDAETPICRALAAIELPAPSGDPDTAPFATLRSCGGLVYDAIMLHLSVPAGVTAAVGSQYQRIRTPAVKRCATAIASHKREHQALSTLYDTDSAHVFTNPQRLDVLRANAKKLLKEHPDRNGADIVWWTVGGDPERVDVYRVQVKLGTRNLRPKETTTICTNIIDGWTNTVAHVFNVGAGVHVNHHAVLLTTRPMTDAAVEAAADAGLGVWGRRDMAPLWPAFIKEFATSAGLVEFLEEEEEEEEEQV